MIRQEVPGVLVSGTSIVVQQQNSFFGSSAPLFLVNGVRVSSISNISPLDVESIVLLKGSQASVYGAEGANGVISITLKTGAEK
jgi:TonB-dependent SusC/RagA subfamily outer membrane receptor